MSVCEKVPDESLISFIQARYEEFLFFASVPKHTNIMDSKVSVETRIQRIVETNLALPLSVFDSVYNEEVGSVKRTYAYNRLGIDTEESFLNYFDDLCDYWIDMSSHDTRCFEVMKNILAQSLSKDKRLPKALLVWCGGVLVNDVSQPTKKYCPDWVGENDLLKQFLLLILNSLDKSFGITKTKNSAPRRGDMKERRLSGLELVSKAFISWKGSSYNNLERVAPTVDEVAALGIDTEFKHLPPLWAREAEKLKRSALR